MSRRHFWLFNEAAWVVLAILWIFDGDMAWTVISLQGAIICSIKADMLK